MARFVFIVQGEGRGHMSQAVAMHQFLERHNHTLDAIFLGIGPYRIVPDYFLNFGKNVLRTFRSPGFVQSQDSKGINILKSFTSNIFHAHIYRAEIKGIAGEIEAINPDIVINFYDLPGAYVIRRLPSGITKIAISHHFYLGHKDFKFPPGNLIQKILLKRLNRLMRKGCDKIGALSFREGDQDGNVQVIPPLIRKEFLKLSRQSGKRNLVYLLHPGYLEDFVRMAEEDKDFEADIFLDFIPKKEMPANITLSLPDDTSFMKKMQNCKSLITTSGFDSIAEAASLSIPVLALPVKNHYEQICNAYDMERAGFGIRLQQFTLDAVNKSGSYDNRVYLDWINQSEKLLLQLIEK